MLIIIIRGEAHKDAPDDQNERQPGQYVSHVLIGPETGTRARRWSRRWRRWWYRHGRGLNLNRDDNQWTILPGNVDDLSLVGSWWHRYRQLFTRWQNEGAMSTPACLFRR